MKTSTTNPTKNLTALLALALFTGATVLPRAARADGDTDRWAIADFYQSLDARHTGAPETAAVTAAAPSPSPARGAAHVGYNKVARRSKAATSRHAAAR